MSTEFLNLFKIEADEFELFTYKPIITPQPSEEIIFQVLNQLARAIFEKEKIPVISVRRMISSPFKIRQESYQIKVTVKKKPVQFKIELQELPNVLLTKKDREYTILLNRMIDTIGKEVGYKRQGQFLFDTRDVLELREKRIAFTTQSSAYLGWYRGVRAFADLFLIVDPKFGIKSRSNLWEETKSYLSYLEQNPYEPDSDALQKVNRIYRGSIVVPEYEIGKSPHKRIVEFDFAKTVDDESETSDGVWRGSPAEYQESLGRKVHDHKQPQVRVKRVDGIIEPHVPELLRITRNLEDLKRRAKSAGDVKAVMKIFRPEPDVRARMTVKFVNVINKPKLAQNMKLSIEPLWIEVENFHPVLLEWANGKVLKIKEDKDFYKAFKSERYQYLRTKSIDDVLMIVPEEKEQVLTTYCKELIEVSNRKGQKLPFPEIISIKECNYDNYSNLFENGTLDLKRDLILTFKSRENDEGLYNLIKKKLISDLGVPSQNVTIGHAEGVVQKLNSSDPMRRGDALTALNLLAMQIVAKIGGAPWKFHEPISREGTMFLGLDVYHDTFRLQPSAGVAVSIFDSTGEYDFGSVAKFQRMGQEHIEKLGLLTRLAIENYRKHKGDVPSYIVAFRHGVAPTFSLENEITTFKDIMDIYGITQYALIMPTQRTYIRMYSTETKDWRRAKHPVPGSAVIGYPFMSNQFLLQESEALGFGTPIPILYTILINEAQFNIRDYVRMSAWLSRHHWASGRAIRIPVPMRYADQLARFVGNIGARPHEKLLGTPFYI